MIGKYRKKPVVIEAIQNTGDNVLECAEFAKGIPPPDGARHFYIDTLEGEMKCNVGDWVIRGVKGECYPCKPDIFEATYEKAEE